MRTGLVYIIIGAVVLWLLGKYRAFRSMEISPGMPRSFSLDGVTVVFILPLQAYNFSGVPVNIGGVDIRIWAEGRYIGRAYILQPVTISGTGRTEIQATCRASMYDISNAIPGFLGGVQDQAVTFRFEGIVNIEGLYSPIDVTYNFNFPQIK